MKTSADRPASARPRAGTVGKVVAGIVALLALVALGLALGAGFFDRDPVHPFGFGGARPARVVAVFFSGDMGLRFGMGSEVAPALAARGIPVYGISSPTFFAHQRSQKNVDTLIDTAARQALARAGADRLVLLGQSFGSDIVVAGLPALAPDLRAKLAQVVLVVPGRTGYFRADPTGLRYNGAPDADAVAAMRRARWAPLTCIYGAAESDSLCPALRDTGARLVALPGGHFLHHDAARLTATIFAALASVIPPPEEPKP